MKLPAFIFRSLLLCLLAFNASAQLSVEKDHLACAYGLKDQHGDWVVPAVYISIYQTPNHNFIALDGIHYGVLDPGGNTLIPFKFTHIEEKLITDLYLYRSDPRKTQQHNFLFITRNMKNCGVWNAQGAEIIRTEYESIVLDRDHLLLYRINNLKKCSSYADQYGNFLFQDLPGFVYPFSGKHNALLAEREYRYYDEGRAYGLIDTLGNVIIPMTYNRISFCKDGFLVQLQGKTGLIDPNGKILHEPRYSVFFTDQNLCLDHSKTYIIYDPGNKKYGFMKGDFTVLLSPDYDKIERLNGSHKTQKTCYKVVLKGKTGMADENGNMTIEPRYDNLVPITYHVKSNIEQNKSGKAKELQKYITRDRFICQENGKFGLISEDGQTLFQAEFDFLDWDHAPLFSQKGKLFALEYAREDPQMTEIPLILQDDSLYLFSWNNFLVPLYMTRQNPDSFTKFDYLALKLGELYYINLLYKHKTAVYDSKGQKLPYNNIRKFRNNDPRYLLFSFGRNEEKSGILDSKTGKLLIDTVYQWIHVFTSDNQIWAGNYNPTARKKEWIVFDTLGKQRINVVFDQVPDIEKTLIVRTGNRTGLLDKNMKWLIPPVYLEIQQINPNFHIAITPGRHIVLLDNAYKLVSDTIYTDFVPVFTRSQENWWMLRNGSRRLLFNSNCLMLDERQNASIDSILIHFALVNGTYSYNPRAGDYAFRIKYEFWSTSGEEGIDDWPRTFLPFKKEMYAVLNAIYERQLRYYSELSPESNGFLYRDSMPLTNELLMPFTTQKAHTGDSLSNFGLQDLGSRYMVVIETDFKKNSRLGESDHRKKRVYSNYVWQNNVLRKISIRDIFGTGSLLEEEIKHLLPNYGKLHLNCSTPYLMVQEIGEKFALSEDGIRLYLLSEEGEYTELLIPAERLQLHNESRWIVQYLAAEP